MKGQERFLITDYRDNYNQHSFYFNAGINYLSKNGFNNNNLDFLEKFIRLDNKTDKKRVRCYFGEEQERKLNKIKENNYFNLKDNEFYNFIYQVGKRLYLLRTKNKECFNLFQKQDLILSGVSL